MGIMDEKKQERPHRQPLLEKIRFVRSIGEETDVVGKEMYTFSDSNDTLSLSLRPEGTRKR